MLVASCLALQIGDHALIDPDEGRSAATALAMATSGDYVVPHLDGLPHLDKPILFYAAEALLIEWLGPTELAARLPSLLAAWATMALTIWFSAHLFGRSTAWVAGTAFATAPLTVAMARTALFDSLLGFFVVLAMMAFYRAVEADDDAPPIRGERAWAAVAWAAMAFGVLTKGPVALVVPLLVAAPYALLRRRSAAIWHPAGWLLHLAIVSPWVLAVEERVPGFLRYALLTETWGRLTTTQLERGGPAWYFLPYLLAGCFPWILVVAGSVRDRSKRLGRRERRPLAFLMLWILVPIVFFSISQSKRPQYILPVVAGCALLVAWSVSGGAQAARGLRAAAIAFLVLGGVFLLVASGAAERLVEVTELASAVRPAALALGALLVGAGLVALGLLRRPGLAAAALSVPVALLPAVTTPLLLEISHQRSGESIARALAHHVDATTRIVGIEWFSPSLVFYLGRSMEVSTSTGKPLGSNFILETYDETVGRQGSALLEPGGWMNVLASCERPTIFLTKSYRRDEIAVLEAAGLPLLYESDRLLAMGPCRPPAAP
jgi:4-amino-4-deoxy-L-arabinose transferase-like glycosyltransferase